MAVKICKDCGDLKPIDDFEKNNHMADGHLNKCKQCRKRPAEYYREYNGNNPEKSRKKSQKYYSENSEKIKESKRVDRLENPEKGKDRIVSIEKREARNTVNNAIRAGKLTRKPCEVCGEVKSAAHHDDYMFPLRVKWLCSKHHGLVHRKS